MEDYEGKQKLISRIEELSRKQQELQDELASIRKEILREENSGDLTEENELVGEIESIFGGSGKTDPSLSEGINIAGKEENKKQESRGIILPPAPSRQKRDPSALEKWVGENLIGTIGIAITVIGVGIGVKYAIDRQLISPAVRILSGYVFGIALGLLAFRLKKSYTFYSALLLGGSIAILYFITYAAYTYFSLIPHILAFGLMVIFTALSVSAALAYKREVIAVIGMMGAYAVPFLLSEDADNALGLFIYMAVINLGILVVSVKQYWKNLYLGAVLVTWLIMFVWEMNANMDRDLWAGFSFNILFFLVFYVAFLAFKLIRNLDFEFLDVILILANSLMFYAIGTLILQSYEGNHDQGLFTGANFALHGIVVLLISRKKRSDDRLSMLIAGLSLVFLVIVIPIELDGSWVTLLWAGITASLVYVARRRDREFYEMLAYPMVIISLFSLFYDWEQSTGTDMELTPFFNAYALSTVLFVVAMYLIHRWRAALPLEFKSANLRSISQFMDYAIATIMFIGIFGFFMIGIGRTWDGITGSTEYWREMGLYRNITNLLFGILYAGVLLLLNIRLWKRPALFKVMYLAGPVLIIAYLTNLLYSLSELRDMYFETSQPTYFGLFENLIFRYVSYLVFIPFASLIYGLFRSSGSPLRSNNLVPLSLHAVILWILSSELLNWLHIFDSQVTYTWGLSILWGIYAVFLVIVGIRYTNSYMRVGGMLLFGITLTKLFTFDLAGLDTMARTIVFISLGLLLLVISYLYFRFRDRLWKDSEDQ